MISDFLITLKQYIYTFLIPSLQAASITLYEPIVLIRNVSLSGILIGCGMPAKCTTASGVWTDSMNGSLTRK